MPSHHHAHALYEKVDIPRDSMRLLLNSMGAQQCRPATASSCASMDEHATSCATPA